MAPRFLENLFARDLYGIAKLITYQSLDQIENMKILRQLEKCHRRHKTWQFVKYMSRNLIKYEQTPKVILKHQSNHGVRSDNEKQNKIPCLLYWRLHTSDFPFVHCHLNFSYSPRGTTKQALFSTSTLPLTIKELHVQVLTFEAAYVNIGLLAGSQYASGRTYDRENRSKICVALHGRNANSEQAHKLHVSAHASHAAHQTLK
jgi:hypothetical protein